MKKIFLTFLLISTLFLGGCSISKLSKISIDELNKKIENKDSFIVYFASDNSRLEDKLNDVLNEYNLEGYKIDASKITSEEKNKLETTIAYDDPCIVFIIRGKDPSKLSHITSESIETKDIVKRLKDINFIK